MSQFEITRLTNAFTKKLENHAHMVALYTLWYISSASTKLFGWRQRWPQGSKLGCGRWRRWPGFASRKRRQSAGYTRNGPLKVIKELYDYIDVFNFWSTALINLSILFSGATYLFSRIFRKKLTVSALLWIIALIYLTIGGFGMIGLALSDQSSLIKSLGTGAIDVLWIFIGISNLNRRFQALEPLAERPISNCDITHS
jgi:hypothetical protein